jgi:hypothetical protein
MARGGPSDTIGVVAPAGGCGTRRRHGAAREAERQCGGGDVGPGDARAAPAAVVWPEHHESQVPGEQPMRCPSAFRGDAAGAVGV